MALPRHGIGLQFTQAVPNMALAWFLEGLGPSPGSGPVGRFMPGGWGLTFRDVGVSSGCMVAVEHRLGCREEGRGSLGVSLRGRGWGAVSGGAWLRVGRAHGPPHPQGSERRPGLVPHPEHPGPCTCQSGGSGAGACGSTQGHSAGPTAMARPLPTEARGGGRPRGAAPSHEQERGSALPCRPAGGE